jgi:hypothetical protein
MTQSEFAKVLVSLKMTKREVAKARVFDVLWLNRPETNKGIIFRKVNANKLAPELTRRQFKRAWEDLGDLERAILGIN